MRKLLAVKKSSQTAQMLPRLILGGLILICPLGATLLERRSAKGRFNEGNL